MINSDKIVFQVFEAIEGDKFLPINTKVSLEYLNFDMNGIFENEHSWRSFINGNFLCEYDKNSWRAGVKESTIKKWISLEEDYIDLFVVKVGKDSYTKVYSEDIILEFDYSLYYNNSSSFPVAVEIFVTATIKGE